VSWLGRTAVRRLGSAEVPLTRRTPRCLGTYSCQSSGANWTMRVGQKPVTGHELAAYAECADPDSRPAYLFRRNCRKIDAMLGRQGQTVRLLDARPVQGRCARALATRRKSG
jgi:hypothetical protein